MATADNSSDTIWQKTKTNSKAGFDKLWAAADKLGAPVNKLSNKLGSEAFWPTTLDKEADKAARILRSFCKDGFYKEEVKESADGPKQKQRVLKKIPTEVIKNAKGLAIFTTMRTGLWISGAGGSGIVVARKEDGSWSPPVGILLHTAGLGFLIGVDIYDCVLVLNTQSALDAFTKVRCTIGGEVTAVAGPVGAGGVLDSELGARRAPIFTYLKSRGFYAGVQIDGTVIVERVDENERFYGSKLPSKRIFAGDCYSPISLRGLTATLKAAQGDDDVDENQMPSEPAPADFEIVQDGHVFGIPDKEDPDPFGVAALSKEGFEVKDATTHERAADSEFQFKPRQESPAFAIVNRRESGGFSPSPRQGSFGSSAHRRLGSSEYPTQTDSDTRRSNVIQSPIQMQDAEGLEDVSLHDEPPRHVLRAPPPLPARGPPPQLPPRNSISPAPAAATETAEPGSSSPKDHELDITESKVLGVDNTEHHSLEVEGTDHNPTEIEDTDHKAPEAEDTFHDASEVENAEHKAPEVGETEHKTHEFEPTESEGPDPGIPQSAPIEESESTESKKDEDGAVEEKEEEAEAEAKATEPKP